MADKKDNNYLKGAAILGSTAIIVKIIGALFKIPLFNIIGPEGSSHFQISYNIYSLLLTVSYSGIPVAMSRLVSESHALGDGWQKDKYFSVALPTFAVVGLVFASGMFIFAEQLGALMHEPEAAMGIRVISPAVFFCCVISVYEGYSQGHGDMKSTAMKQLLEVTSKLLLGLLFAVVFINLGKNSEIVAAGSLTGVSVGMALALPMLIIYKRRHAEAYHTSDSGNMSQDGRQTLYKLLRVSIPITLAASFINILSLIDTSVVKLRLEEGALFAHESASFMYGSYAQTMSLFNLPPSLIIPVTVSIIPAISAAVTSNDHELAHSIMGSAFKLITIIALPVALGLCVLAKPIFYVIYGDNPYGGNILAILGLATYFVCMQLTTTAMLQANGYERFTLISFLAGGLAQILVDWFLVGNAKIGIIGSPIGTFICYLTITLINLILIYRFVKDRPNFPAIVLKPLLSTAVMSVTAFLSHRLLEAPAARILGNGRLAGIIPLGLSVLLAVIVYVAMILLTRTITREDLRFVPKSEKIVQILHLK